MNGYQITFFTESNRSHKGKQLADWIVELALEMRLPGATKIAASEGYGSDRRIHSVHFFELGDQPLQIQITVTAEDSDRLFERLRAEKVHLFYVKSPVEFGTLGETDA
jgi:PII-like signaling protein